MKEYDVIVIGSGAGLSLAYRALSGNMKVALVAKEFPGGTCINVGCVPSKTMIHAADMVRVIEQAGEFGIRARIDSIDFPGIMENVRNAVRTSAESIRSDLKESEGLDYHEEECQFVDDYTISAGGETIRAKKIFIATGARPAVPPITGLADIDYLTNESVLSLTELPRSLIIVGGSYIGVEFAHFFAAMGTEVSIIEYLDSLVAFEEPEISQLLEESLAKRMKIYTGHEAVSIAKNDGGCSLTVRDRATKAEKLITGQRVMVATGRISNADRLKPDRTGVRLTQKGFVEVNEYLETSKTGILALGDATGKGMFTHAGDKEVEIAWHNAFNDNKLAMDFALVPHAVFTEPQIASVGLTESQAANGHDVVVGRASYTDTVQGDIRKAEGFAKAVIEKNTGMILGFHIIGPDAAVLIQEVVNVFAQKGDYRSITEVMHIFPSLSDLITETLGNV
jgi:mycothione reductase